MTHPVERFHAWFAEAKAHPHIAEPTAMSLATATPQAAPSVRIVLLKEADERGFVFYTNAEGRKGRELAANAQAALCFYWMPLMRQVRVEGRVVDVSREESDEYFAHRHRESQIGAWASLQSRLLDRRETLERRIVDTTEKFAGQTIPRPDYWHGYRLIPSRIEFWAERPFRLHDREVYEPDGSGGWNVTRLYP